MRLKVKRTMRIDSEEPLTDGVPAHLAVAGMLHLPLVVLRGRLQYWDGLGLSNSFLEEAQREVGFVAT